MLWRVAAWALAASACTARADEPHHFTPSLVYDGAAISNLGGGLRRGTTYSGDLNVRAYVDLAPWIGIADLYGYSDVLWVHGGQPSALTGDAQGISNISAPAQLQLYEMWLQKNAFSDGLSLLAGLYDVNSEFYRLQTAGLFLNSSFGIGPELGQSGIAGPSIFPRTAWGARASVRAGDYFSLQTAVVNGVPFERPNGSRSVHEAGDGVLVLAELSVVDRFRRGGQRPSQRFRLGRNASQPSHDNKLAIGAWYYTAKFDDELDVAADGMPLQRRGSSGYYAIGESLLYETAGSPKRRLSAFAQMGSGDGRVNRFEAYGGAGLTATGLLHEAGDDELGIAVNVARSATHYLRARRLEGSPAGHAERVVEISYLLPVAARLAVQPDLQLVHRPNSDPTLKDAVAVQLRFELTY